MENVSLHELITGTAPHFGQNLIKDYFIFISQTEITADDKKKTGVHKGLILFKGILHFFGK